MTQHPPTPDEYPAPRRVTNAPMRIAALAFGVVFLLIGFFGFIPGLTTNADHLAWAGHHSEALLFGIFQVSILHNAVHLAFGAAGILSAGTSRSATIYFLAGGTVYVALWVYGLVVPQDSPANIVPLNSADNWLHLGLALAMLTVGVLFSGHRTRLQDRADPPPPRS
ncbi:MAG TPA: DUF4383 domain-containing protein [Arachnia sp.]|nr:DUF4383 domain-containing protein [Arachnia sp.]HMT87445.1 DUF4383 domain-containing protein [Arachnia sp.]